MPRVIDVAGGWRTSLRAARNPGLLAFVGAVLLICAPALPGLSRLVVLPALLLAPGYALLRLLGQASGQRSISVAVPVSLVLAVCASLVLDVSGIRLGPLSLGLLLGAVTALCLAGSYGRQLSASSRRWLGHDRLARGTKRPGHGVRGHDQPLRELITPDHLVLLKAAPVPLNIRFHADQPNECWQTDFAHYSLADGADAQILTWLDDHSGLALSVTAHHCVTCQDVLATFRATAAAYGLPASTLTGNDTVYTTWLSEGRGGSNGFERELRRMGITQKNGRPSHPQTQEKVQRFQRTLERWLSAQPAQPESLAGLQALLDTFTADYNEQQPHGTRGRASPATAYAARPKATPGDRVGDSHYRVLSEYVDKTGTVPVRYDGRLQDVGIGRKYAGIPVLLMVYDSRIRIVHARTGELLSNLILEPQGQHQTTPPGDVELGQRDATQ